MNTDNHLLKWTFWLSITMYGLSLCFPGFSTENGSKEGEWGLILVLVGWSDIFGAGAGYTWLANPFMWLAFSYYRKPVRSLIFAVAAFLLMFLFVFSRTITGSGWCGNWLESADCPQVKISKLHAGYYFWLGSSILLSLSNVLRLFSRKKITA